MAQHCGGRRAVLKALATLAGSAAWPALAQNEAAASLLEYQGADRDARIVAAAKKEGTFTWYTSFAEKDIPTVVEPFERKYGVKVKVWRASTEKVLQRT